MLVVLLAATSLFAQSGAQKSEVVVYYRYDKHSIDHHYLTNPEAFATLDSIFYHKAHAIDSIAIVAHASPEGRTVYNQWLSSKRAASMKGFLKVKYPKVDFSNLKTYARGEDFEGLIRMVEADKDVPYQKQVLKILRQKNKHADVRMKELYKLRGGTPYRYIRKNILPWLRTATTCIIYYNAEALAADESMAVILEQPIGLQPSGVGVGSLISNLTLEGFVPAPVRMRSEALVSEQPQRKGGDVASEQPAGVGDAAFAEGEGEGGVDHLVAFKTNLLFDAVGAVNVSAELPLGKRFSLEGSWTFPWYLDREWQWCYQLLWGEVEGRMWLGERTRANRLRGHFVGLYAGGGLYDFQWREKDGYQGEFFLAAGLSYGYSFSLGERWRMELEFGIGYLESNYRHYFHVVEPNGDHTLVRDNVSGKFGYWGPTKAKVSLVLPIEWGVSKDRSRRID